MKDGITLEKKEEEKQRVRGEILQKIAEKAKFSPYGGSPEGRELPEAIIEQEQQRLLEDFKNRVSQMMGGKGFSAQGGPASGWEEYLASVKKTEAEIKETYKKEAEKRLSGFLVLRELGKLEKIEVSDKEVEEEVAKSIKNYSKEQLAQIDINELKEYTKGVINNEKIFQILEKLSQ
jgi:trigger factor